MAPRKLTPCTIHQPNRTEPQTYTPINLAPLWWRQRASRKTWDQEMAELFCEFQPISTPTAAEHIYSERQPRLYRIWDISQKFLLLMNNILIAGPQTSSSPEQLMAVLPNNALDPVRQPIFMGLGDKTLTLACVKAADGRPGLKLIERSIMDLYRNTEESLSFTFYSRTDGNQETCCFESAAFPGWFMSTSTQLNKPVGLSLEGGSQITIFYFERKR